PSLHDALPIFLQLGMRGRHRVDADVLLVRTEVDEVATTEGERRHLVGDGLPGRGCRLGDGRTHLLQDRLDFVGEHRDVLVDVLGIGVLRLVTLHAGCHRPASSRTAAPTGIGQRTSMPDRPAVNRTLPPCTSRSTSARTISRSSTSSYCPTRWACSSAPAWEA